MTRGTRWSVTGWSQVLIVALLIAVCAPLAAADEAPAFRSRRVEYPAPVEGPVSEPPARVQSAAPESGATLYVPADYATIQAAVSAAAPGDIIVVAAGTYTEGFPIAAPTQNLLVDKSLTLLGPNAGKAWNDPTRVAEAIIRPVIDDPDGNVPVVAVTASDVRIDGFTIDGNNPALPPLGTDQLVGGVRIHAGVGIQNGIYNYSAGLPMYGLTNVDYLTIDNNIFRNNSYAGIFLWDTYGVNNSGNYIRHNGFDTMWEGLQIYAVHAVISDNTFSNVRRGLSTHAVNTAADLGFTPTISGNTVNIAGNLNIYTDGGTYGTGIWVNYRAGLAPSLTVLNNTINAPNPMPAGKIFRGFTLWTVEDDQEVVLSGNTVNGNGAGQFGVYGWALTSSVPPRITGGSINNVTGAAFFIDTYDNDPTWGGHHNVSMTADNIPVTLSAGAVGARAYFDPAGTTQTASLALTGVSFAGGATGLLADGATATLTAEGCTVTGATTGILTQNGGAATVHLSRIAGNTTGASAASGTIDATNNWWGCNAGPGGTGCDSVPGSGVTFSPWLILSLSAIPETVPASGGTAALDANIFTNSAVPAILFGTGAFPSTGSVAFSATAPHSVSPTPLTLSGGAASSIFTTGATQGNATVTGTLDGQTVSTSVIVGNPLPSIASLSPTSEPAGTAGPVILTVTGTGFTSGSVISWNGMPVGTFFNSATEIYTLLMTANLAAAGTYPVTVTNPAPAGGTSNAVDFVVNNPQPVLTSMAPAAIATGSADFTLTLNGSAFVNGAAAYWDGAALATTFVSATKLTAAVPAANVAAVGSHTVQVKNPTPNLGDSATLTFQVSTPTDVFVDDNYVGLALGTSVDWPYTGSGLHSIGFDAFATIQAGVNAVGATGTVHVAAGMYAEQVLIGKAVALLGPNAGKAGFDPTRASEALIVPPSILNAASSPREWNWDAVLDIEASQVTVKGLAVSCDNPALDGYHYAGMNIECGIGVYSEGNQVTFQNNIVTKGTVMGFWAGGLQTVSYTGLALADNAIDSIQDLNQLGYGFGMYVQATAGTVSGNRITNCRNGMQIQPYRVVGAPALVTGNAVSSWRTGIYYNYSEDGASAWTITGNTVSACTAPAVPAGLVAWDGIKAETMRSTGNGGTISNNTVNGLAALTDPAHTGWGGFHQAVWGLHYAGSASTSTQVLFTNNTVTNVEFGMVHDAPADIVFTGNSLSTTVPPTGSEQAIVLQRSYNSAGVQQSYGGTNNIDATGGNTINGVATGTANLAELFAIENAMRHKVDDATLGLLRVRPLNLYVTPNSFAAPNTTTPSIQRAIDAASAGWTVNVGDGSYLESNITIVKPLTLAGQSQAGVIIGPSMADGHDDGTFTAPLSNGILLQSGDVAIRNLTLDGNVNSVPLGSDHNFRAGVITDHRTGFLYNNLTVQNVTVQHTWRRGIQLLSSTSGTKSSGHLITGNTIDDVVGAGYCTGLVGFDTTNSVFSNNTVSNVLSGIEMVQWYATGGSKITVQGNTLSGVNTGIQLVVPADGSLVGGLLPADGNTITVVPNTRDNDGIIVRNATGTVTVQNNAVTATGKASGLSMFGNSDPAHPVLVLNNTFTSSGSTSSAAGEGTGVFLSDDTLLFGDAGGLPQADLPTYATIAGNTVTGFVRGVDLYRNGITSGAGGQIVSATIGGDNPSTDNNTITAATGGTGIRVFDADGAANGYKAVATIQNNRATITGALVGIDVDGGDATLTLNAVTGNGTGVLFHNGATGSATLNDLSGNTAFGIENSNPTGSIPSTCNWWGNITGPNHATNPGGTGSIVSDGVAFSTWAGAPYDCSTQYGIPTRLVFTLGPPASTGAGISFPVTVQAQDGAGNLATGFNGAFGGVALALSGGTSGAILAGGSASAVNGVATFTLSVDRGGTGYSLGASATYGGSALAGVSGTFDITNPAPTLNTLSPAWARVDAATPFTLSLTGTNFVPTSAAYWGATALTTTYVDATHLTASVVGPLAVGTVSVTVVNGPPPATFTSDPLPFVVRDIPMTVWVDDGWAGHASGDPVDGHIFGYDAFSVIQDGINAVATTGTVNVYPGTYTENLSIAKTLSLVGNFGSLPRPVVQSGASGTNLALVSVSAPNVRIENMELQVDLCYYQDGIRAVSGTLSGIVIKNNLLHSYNSAPPSQSSWPYNGINVGGTGSLVTLQGNTVTGTATVVGGFPFGVFGRGIWLHGARGLVGGANSGEGNTLYGFRDILAQFVSGGDLTIQANDCTGGGVDITEPDPGLKTVWVLGNSFTGPNADGTLLIKNVIYPETSVVAQNNIFTGCAIGVWSGASRNVTLRNNMFTPPALGDFVHVRVDSSTNGTTSGTVNGIALYGNVFHQPASGTAGTAVAFMNTRTGGTFPSIILGGAGTDANQFEANLARFMVLDGTAGHEFGYGPIDASQNLFDLGGGPKLPSVMTLAELFPLEDKIQHKVDYALLGLVRVQPTALFVTPASFLAPFTATPSIQRAIDAATAGDTVNVAAGTYAQNLVVNKALTLSGPNAGKTGWATRDPEALLLPSTVGPYALDPDHSTTILRATASSVTVDGFAFDGHNPLLTGGKMIDGVEVHAAAGISNYADDHGYAVPVSEITLENSRFAHFGYCGVDLEGNGTTPTVDSLIQGNYFTSIDPGNTPVYGWGVGVVLAENGYADVLNNHGDNVRKGIQTNNFYRANTGTTASIKNNNFETWGYGLYHNLHYSDASPFTITGNTFRAAAGSTTNRGLGLSSLQGPVGATIQNNAIQGGFAGFEAWNIPVTVPITIEGGSATGCQYGLLLWNNQVPGYGKSSGTSLLNVTGTSITGSTSAGIRVFDDPANTEPLCNMILTATGLTVTGDVVGIQVENSRASATITNSDLSGNASFGANNLGGTLTATCDWWGDGTGPYSATLNPGATLSNSPVSGGVTFSPWAGTNAFNCSLAYGLPARLVFTTQPSNGTAGAAINPNVTVRAEDTSGNLAYSFNATVTLALNGGTAGATAAGNSAAAVNGVATFPALSVDRGGTAYTFTAGATYGTVPVSSDASNAFNIDNPVPTLLSMSPTWVRIDAATPVTLSLTGTNFVPTSTVYLGATALVTTYVDGAHLTGAVPAPLAVGSVSVTVVNGPPPATNTSNPLPFEVLPIPMTVWVDLAWTGHVSGDSVGGHLFGYDAFAVIQDGVNAVGTTGTVNVAAGTYLAEVNVNRAMLLHGAGMDQVTLMGRKNANPRTTLAIAGNAVTVEGFTITRDGNNPTDWAGNFKDQGVQFDQGVTGSTLQFCKVTGNRNGVYLNNAQGNTIRNNIIDFNRTGIHLVNNVTGTVITQNMITNNWTLGVIFNTVWGGETSATTGLTVADNSISGNWYTQVECRWTLSTATLDVSGNWLGSSALTVHNNTDAGEPGYTAQIPVEYGGTAVNPGGAYSVGGVHSERVDYTPWLNTGTDTAPGTIGFQGDFSYLNVGALSPQYGATPRIAEAIGLVTPTGTVKLTAGTFTENVVVNKPLTLMGSGQLATTVLPALSAPNPCSNSSLCGGAASNIILVQADNVTVNDMTLDGDNPLLTSGIEVGGADLDARNGIISNSDAGTFNLMTVHNCTVRNIYLRGIYAASGGSFNFHHNTVTNVQANPSSIGMFAWGGPGTMADNTVSLCNDAISANHSKGIQFLRNTVTNSASGIHTDNSGDGGGVADLIQGNTVTDGIGGYGIWTFVPYLAPVVEDNTITNCDVGLSAWGQGAAVTAIFRRNTVTLTTPRAGSAGAYITTDWIYYGYSDLSVNFQNNTISGYETGIYLTADPQSWNPKPYVSHTIDATFFNNNIYDNTAGMSMGAQGTYDVTANCNWWGDATGPYNLTLNPAGLGNRVDVPTGPNFTVVFVPWATTDNTGTPAYDCNGYVPPTLSSADMTGPYTAGVSHEFHVSVDNPALGNTYSHVRFNFTISGTVLADIAAFEYLDGATWRPMPLTQSGSDVTGYYGPVGGFPMPAPYSATGTFRITPNTAKTYPVTIQLVNLDAGSAILASLTATALANPGTPVITGITDNNACAQDGILVTYTPGAGAASHTLVVDGTTLVPNYASGALYNPGDTATHTYVIRAVGGASTTDSAGSSFADVNDTPVAVTNVVVDNPDCTGARVTFTASPNALAYELWVDGTLKVTDFVSGGRYTPADGSIHSYVVRAVRNTCFTDSAPVAFAVVNLTPPRVTDSLMVTKSGNNMLLAWALILPANVVDYYQVGRFIPQPSGPPLFDTVIGTASGQVNGIQVSLSGEPANAMYLVRAVKGTCYGPWE